MIARAEDIAGFSARLSNYFHEQGQKAKERGSRGTTGFFMAPGAEAEGPRTPRFITPGNGNINRIVSKITSNHVDYRLKICYISLNESWIGGLEHEA